MEEEDVEEVEEDDTTEKEVQKNEWIETQAACFFFTPRAHAQQGVKWLVLSIMYVCMCVFCTPTDIAIVTFMNQTFQCLKMAPFVS